MEIVFFGIENIPWKVSIMTFSLYFTSHDSRHKFPPQDWRLNPFRFCAEIHQFRDVSITGFLFSLLWSRCWKHRGFMQGKNESQEWYGRDGSGNFIRMLENSKVFLHLSGLGMRTWSQGFPLGFFQVFQCTFIYPGCWGPHSNDFPLDFSRFLHVHQDIPGVEDFILKSPSQWFPLAFFQVLTGTSRHPRCWNPHPNDSPWNFPVFRMC